MRLKTFDNTDMKNVTRANAGPEFFTPCECGCDERDGPMLGYVQIIRDYKGMSIIAEDEDDLELLSHLTGLMTPQEVTGA